MHRRDATLKRLLSTGNKISRVSAHPIQSWVALVDKNSGAQIWDWNSGEILFTAQFGGIDESAMHYHSLQKMAEVDPAYWGAKTSQEQSISKTPSGKLKFAEFFDVETLYWHRVRDLSIIKGRAGEIVVGKVPGAVAVRRDRWVIFVCENKLLFHELISHKSYELSKMALDSKNPSCISILTTSAQGSTLDDAMIAIGCNDGTIRVISFSTFKTVAKLGYRSAQVSCLMTLHTAPNMTLLIAGTQEGNLYTYDPFPSVSAAGASLPPITTLAKAHDGEILSMALSYASPHTSTPGIFVLGGDRSVGIYEVPSLKCTSKFRCPNPKPSYHSMNVCDPLEACPEKSPVLVAAQNIVYGTTLAGGANVTIIDPTALAPPQLKKNIKVYHFTLHPLQRHWAILGTNAGAMVVRIDVAFHATAISLPIPKTPKQTLELTCLRVRKQSLLQSEFMVVQQESAGDGIVRCVPETIMDREAFHLSEAFVSGGQHQITLSPDATKIAISHSSSHTFVVLSSTGQGSWTPAFEGEGCGVAWNATSDTVATLNTPPATQPVSSQKSLIRLRSRTESSRGASPELLPTAAVKVYKLGSTSPMELATAGNGPILLHGGPLLGVTYGPRAGSERRAFAFFSWETLQECCDELESPEWLTWSDTFELCAFAYPSHILIFQALERFFPLMSVPIEEAVSGIWKGDLLYVTTTTSVECVVMQRSKRLDESNTIRSVHIATLASFRSGPNWLTGEVETTACTEKPLPIGHLKILNASHDRVWVADSHENPATIDVTYPGFLALVHSIDETYSAAREAAIGKLSPDCLGQMFLTMCKRSAIEALKLPGLSLPLRLKTAIEARYLKHAIFCFKAIVQGCRRPEAIVRLAEFKDTLKEKLPTPKKSLLEGGSPSRISPFAGGDFSDSAPPSLVTAIGESSIDWEKALQFCTKTQLKRESLDIGREILELGVALHDAAVEERMYDVADEAFSLVVQHCDEAKDGDLIVQLETRLSAREQTGRLKDLISLSEKSKKSNNGQLKGFAAAALCGDALALSEFLQSMS